MENFTGAIDSVKLDLKACSVSIVAVDGSGLKGVEYTGAKDLEPVGAFEGGKLTFTQKPVGVFGSGVMATNKPRLMITIGKDTILKFVDIYLKAGDLSVNGITADWYSEVIDAGNITIEGCTFLKAEIRTKAGNTYIKSTNLNQTVIDANAGSVKLEAIEDLERYDISCSVKTGDVKIAGEHCARSYSSKGKADGAPDYIRINVKVGSIAIN